MQQRPSARWSASELFNSEFGGRGSLSFDRTWPEYREGSNRSSLFGDFVFVNFSLFFLLLPLLIYLFDYWNISKRVLFFVFLVKIILERLLFQKPPLLLLLALVFILFFFSFPSSFLTSFLFYLCCFSFFFF